MHVRWILCKFNRKYLFPDRRASCLVCPKTRKWEQRMTLPLFSCFITSIDFKLCWGGMVSHSVCTYIIQMLAAWALSPFSANNGDFLTILKILHRWLHYKLWMWFILECWDRKFPSTRVRMGKAWPSGNGADPQTKVLFQILWARRQSYRCTKTKTRGERASFGLRFAKK